MHIWWVSVEKFLQLNFADEISTKYEWYNKIMIKSVFWLLFSIGNEFWRHLHKLIAYSIPEYTADPKFLEQEDLLHCPWYCTVPVSVDKFGEVRIQVL